MRTIQELEKELAKHRKLLHRAVGNQILPHINYHHYEIVQIINEMESEEMKRNRLSLQGVFDSGVKALGYDFGKMLQEQIFKIEDNEILNGTFRKAGQFGNIITNHDGSHSDIYLPE